MTLFSKTSLLALLGTLALAPLDVSAMEKEDAASARPRSPLINLGERLKALQEILDCKTTGPKEKVDALSAMREIEQHPACSSAQRADIAMDLFFNAQQARGISILLSLLKNPATPIADRTKALDYMLTVGTGAPRAEARSFFMTIAQDPTASKAQCLKIAQRCIFVGEQEEKAALFPVLLHLLPAPEFNTEDHFHAASLVNLYGTDAQKVQVLPFLLPMMQDATMDLEKRVQAADHVLVSGTEEQKAGAASFLMTIARDSTAPAKVRSSAGEAILHRHKTAEARMDLLLLGVSDPVFAALWRFALCNPRDLILISPELRAFLLQHAAELYAGDFVSLIPAEDMENLVYTLAAQPQDQWPATTAHIIRQYQRVVLTQPQLAFLGRILATIGILSLQERAEAAHEVHHYARSVKDPVMAAVDQRLEGVTRMSYEEARTAVTTWIAQNERDPAKANAKVDEGLGTAEDQDLLARVYTFVLTQHPGKMDLFLRGFVQESMTAFSGHEDPTSCPKGIKERVFTGLRGMDSALDALFQAAETALTAQTFVTQCNFGASDNALEWMVKKLRDLHVTAQTSAEEAAEIFKVYAADHLKSFPLTPADLQKHMDQLESMADVLVEFYEEKIKPHMPPAQAAVDPSV